MSLLLNNALAQQLTAGTYGSPRTTKGPLIPLPVVQHGSKVGPTADDQLVFAAACKRL
jgi:hypothetical protein